MKNDLSEENLLTNPPWSSFLQMVHIVLFKGYQRKLKMPFVRYTLLKGKSKRLVNRIFSNSTEYVMVGYPFNSREDVMLLILKRNEPQPGYLPVIEILSFMALVIF